MDDCLSTGIRVGLDPVTDLFTAPHLFGMRGRTDLAGWVLSLFLLVNKKDDTELGRIRQ